MLLLPLKSLRTRCIGVYHRKERFGARVNNVHLARVSMALTPINHGNISSHVDW